MKRVLLAFDGRHFSKGVFEFVKQMNKHQPVSATGFFLPAVDYVELLYSYGGVPAAPIYINEGVGGEDKILRDNIERFAALCQQNGIAYKIQSDFTKHVVTQIKEKTRYSDLLVLSSKSFYENLGEEIQNDYVDNVLHKAECPVVLAPENYKEPTSIIMAYDGSEQSVFAIKQFTYLFPELHALQVLLVYIDKSKAALPDRADIEELLSGHFERISILKLKIDAQKDLEKWITDNGDTMLVAGAYGRSLFSEMFRKSFINDVIHHHKVPIFVAHR